MQLAIPNATRMEATRSTADVEGGAARRPRNTRDGPKIKPKSRAPALVGGKHRVALLPEQVQQLPPTHELEDEVEVGAVLVVRVERHDEWAA